MSASEGSTARKREGDVSQFWYHFCAAGETIGVPHMKGIPMASRGKVELFAAIRRDARKGMSGRALALKYGVHRRTVAQALRSAWPTPRKPLPPRASRLDSYKPLIDQMLRVDLDAPPKQRHTVVRMWNRLLEEHGAEDVSYSMVRDYVRRRRAEIRLEEGRGPSAVFIEQTHQPGAEARWTSAMCG